MADFRESLQRARNIQNNYAARAREHNLRFLERLLAEEEQRRLEEQRRRPETQLEDEWAPHRPHPLGGGKKTQRKAIRRKQTKKRKRKKRDA